MLHSDLRLALDLKGKCSNIYLQMLSIDLFHNAMIRDSPEFGVWFGNEKIWSWKIVGKVIFVTGNIGSGCFYIRKDVFGG